MASRTTRIEHIFELFTQIQNETTRNYGGTGLGLAITKYLIEMQGGTIQVESVVKKGSTFTFTIPYSLTHPPPQLHQNRAALNELLKDKQILYVEDIAINQFLLQNLAKMWQINLTTVSSGVDAMQKIEEMRSQGRYFDLIITDILMPVMDGYQVAQAIRQHPDGKIASTPIIALTADVSATVEEKAKSVGIDFCLAKPIDHKIFYQRLTTILTESPSEAVQLNAQAFVVTGEDKFKPDFISDNQSFIDFLQITAEQIKISSSILSHAVMSANVELYRQEIHALKPTLSYIRQENIIERLQAVKPLLTTAGAEERNMAAIKICNLLEHLHRQIELKIADLQKIK